MNSKDMERLIAARIMRYFPLFDPGMYSSTIYDQDGNPIHSITVQFNPSYKIEDALSILHKLTEMGWDYDLKCNRSQSFKREMQGIPISPYELRLYKDKKSIYSVDIGNEPYNQAQTMIDAIMMGAYGVCQLLPKYEAAEEEFL